MTEKKIQYPDYMERSLGFSIPDGGKFYVFYFEELVHYDLDTGRVQKLDVDWEYDSDRNLLTIQGESVPFIGIFGGAPILEKDDVGVLSLEDSKVTLKTPKGKIKCWELENFSGDWEQVTFDSSRNALLFGAPYDFDYRYISF